MVLGLLDSRFRGNDSDKTKGGKVMTVLLDPTSERSPTVRARLPRPERLDGLTIGLLDIAKARGEVFLHRLDQRLREQGLAVKRHRKPTKTRPAPPPLHPPIANQSNLPTAGPGGR